MQIAGTNWRKGERETKGESSPAAIEVHPLPTENIIPKNERTSPVRARPESMSAVFACTS